MIRIGMPFARRLLLATIAALVATTAAQAQSAIRFDLCLAGALPSCTQLAVTTTPIGQTTVVDVAVRQLAGGSLGTALTSFAFIVTDPDALAAIGTPPDRTLTAIAGAPAVATPVTWRTRTDIGGLGFQDTTSSNSRQYIASCNGRASSSIGRIVVPLTTCGTEAYLFRTVLDVPFEASAITGLTLDLFAARPATPNDFGTVVTCDVGDGRADLCIDFGNLDDPVVPFTYARVVVPESTVPEPATLALVALGVPLLLSLRRRRTRRR